MKGVMYMGAGNWLPGNRGDLLDYQGYYVEYEGIYGERYFDEDLSDEGEMDDFIENVIYGLKAKFKDLSDSNEWRSRDEKIYLEDDIIQLVMGDNENSAALYFILEDYYDEEEEREVIEEYRAKFAEYVEGLKDILIEYYPGCVKERAGAWTSAAIG